MSQHPRARHRQHPRARHRRPALRRALRAAAAVAAACWAGNRNPLGLLQVDICEFLQNACVNRDMAGLIESLQKRLAEGAFRA